MIDTEDSERTYNTENKMMEYVESQILARTWLDAGNQQAASCELLVFQSRKRLQPSEF
jgi:hypothetical protein